MQSPFSDTHADLTAEQIVALARGGVIGYIDDTAIDRSLRFMAGTGGTGSRLAFTFGQIGFETDTATARTQRAGFRLCEEIAGDDLWRRYLPGEPHPNAWVTRIGTAIA